MIYYITDSDGNVVGQFDGVDVDVKDSHSKNYVDDINDLPGIDVWHDHYLNQ